MATQNKSITGGHRSGKRMLDARNKLNKILTKHHRDDNFSYMSKYGSLALRFKKTSEPGGYKYEMFEEINKVVKILALCPSDCGMLIIWNLREDSFWNKVTVNLPKN